MFTKTVFVISFIAGCFLFCPVSATQSIQLMDKNDTPLFQPASPDSSAPSLNGGLLEELLKSHPKYFEQVLKNRNEWNVQVIYTRVNRDEKGTPELEQFTFNVDPSRYFYPASAVKLPVALLALQRLNELKSKGIDKKTTMITEAELSGQTAVYNDPTTPFGNPTVAHYIKKIFLVSDNDAFNRLYEFLGQQYINDELHKKGYDDVQILHRLKIALSGEENRQTNPVRFINSNNIALYVQSAQKNNANYPKRNDFIGQGYYSANQLINSPMNFSGKNRISLPDLHKILVSLIFPERVPINQRFNLTEEDKQFVLKYLSQLPTESIFPPYAADTATYWPAYCKFLLCGAEKGKFPENIRIFNKTGDAYGQLVDNAYVVDFKKGIEFFLSATIYCNSDGILNDDKYNYDTIGLPFLKHLGQVVYEYEQKRERKRRPDLSPFIFEYDK